MGKLLLALVLLSLNVAAQDGDLPPLPALNDPPTDLQIPGKFVWSDLFTSDMEANERFYGALFGWQWRWITRPDRRYGIFSMDGYDVAGMVHRPAPEGQDQYGRWVHYISVADVGGTEGDVVDRGGETLLPRRQAEHRGEFAIVSDPQGAIFGMIRSSSGDPGDFRAEPGEFIWYQLFTHEVDPAAEFYQALFRYDIVDRADSPDVVDYVLQSGDHARAGIGGLKRRPDSHPTWLGYVRVEDVAATVELAKTLGGEILLAPSSANLDGDMAIVADPSGTPIGLLRWDYPEEEEGR